MKTSIDWFNIDAIKAFYFVYFSSLLRSS